MELNNMYVNSTMLEKLAKEIMLNLHYFSVAREKGENQKSKVYISQYYTILNTLKMMGIKINNYLSYGIELSYQGHTAYISSSYFQDEKNLKKYLDNK